MKMRMMVIWFPSSHPRSLLLLTDDFVEKRMVCVHSTLSVLCSKNLTQAKKEKCCVSSENVGELNTQGIIQQHALFP